MHKCDIARLSNSEASGCLFRLGQALIKKNFKAYAKLKHQSTPIFKKYFKKLIALSFVIIDRIEDTFNQNRNLNAFH